MREQIGDPRRVVDVVLASRNVADMSGICQDQLEAAFEDVPDRFPIDASRFHGHVRAAMQGKPVAGLKQSDCGGSEAAHFAILWGRHAAHASHTGVLVDVESGAAGIENLHGTSCQSDGSGSSPRDRILVSVLGA
ncbi:hypothetical protein NK8_83600 (plasmid) [Caballeronia sp. NK8]|nr:hypothetical protein NK8_83600 [Caballeronia sp. NK8]